MGGGFVAWVPPFRIVDLQTTYGSVNRTSLGKRGERAARQNFLRVFLTLQCQWGGLIKMRFFCVRFWDVKDSQKN